MDNLDKIIESILFVAGDGVDYFDISDKLNISTKEVENAVKQLQEFYENNNSGIRVLTFNGKAQLCSNSDYSEEVSQVLNPIKEKALTKAVMETVAIIAYKQPITRLEIEQVRGVNSDYAINNLIENKLIEVVGRKDAIGKPLLFGTTDLFLKRFSLTDLAQLPDYDELLEQIEVIKTPKTNGLFDYSGVDTSIDEEQAELKKNNDEENSEDNDIVSDILDALNNDSELEEQA